MTDPDFEAFVRATQAPLYGAALLLVGDHHHAQDLVQETYARVARHWSSLSRPGGAPYAYAHTTLYRLAIDRWRTRARRVTEHPSDEIEQSYAASARSPASPPAGDAATDDRLVIRQALARLTPRQRAVLILRYVEDRTEVETAALLGCSVNTVKSQARLALRRIRELAPDLLADLDPGGAPNHAATPATAAPVKEESR